MKIEEVDNMKLEQIQNLFKHVTEDEFVKFLKDKEGNVIITETATAYVVYMVYSYITLGGNPLDLTIWFDKYAKTGEDNE